MYTSSVIFPRCNFAWNNATRKLPGIATKNFDDTVVGPTVIQWFIHGTHTNYFPCFTFPHAVPCSYAYMVIASEELTKHNRQLVYSGTVVWGMIRSLLHLFVLSLPRSGPLNPAEGWALSQTLVMHFEAKIASGCDTSPNTLQYTGAHPCNQ